MMKPRIPKPTSGHLDRFFFVRCPEVGLGILKPTSGHLARRLRRRCPEVGLGIPGSCDVASVCAKFSFSLRLRWRAGF